ncbi:unnamed protein product [Alternaria alternata]
MRPSNLVFAAVGLLSPIATSALELNVDDPASIREATKVVAAGLREWYTGDRPGDVPGNLPDPYYWWLCGAMFNSFIDYWYYTGDDTYNAITRQAMVHQIGNPKAFMPDNQTSTLGNDDQAFWGMTAMSAAETKLPDVEGEMSWLSLAIAVFNTQAPRWNTQTCGGGLNWQIFRFNNGFDYKNTISNGAFFNIAARLAKYTGNATYVEWAERAWDWQYSVGLISPDYHFFDGTSERQNCTEKNHIQWTYNAGIHMSGVAALWNMSETNGDAEAAGRWRERLGGIINGTDIFFNAEGAPGVMIEMACERNGLCDHDQRSFKAYLSRWMGYTMLSAPWTRDRIMPKLRTSAAAAAQQCSAGKGGCGLRWWRGGVNDGEVGVGEQMSALEVMQNLLVDQVSGPVGLDTGGISENDPTAGSDGGNVRIEHDAITTGDKAGAAILTIVVFAVFLGGGGWLIMSDFNFTTRYKSTVIAVTYRKSPDTSLKPTITILASAEEITEMTSTKSFSSTPAGAQQQPTPFDLHVEEQKLQEFKTLLKLSPVAKDTYENKQDEGSHGKFGVSRQWIVDTKKEWVEKFDWRKEEDRINSFPNFKTTIKDDDSGSYDVHFVALFSNKSDAIPIAFFHGWPGSFLEFLPLMDLLRKKYTPDTLPYHIIAPSLPGFGLSSDPPLQKDWKVADTSRIMHKLLLSLGFGPSGYLVQGGDIGSLISREIAATGMTEFMEVGRAYAIEHGTKPSTIGLVLSSSPIAQLAWIGEKFLAWSDPSTTPSLNTILSDITLYWLTGCYPTSIYTYREAKETKYVDKPTGYSWFPFELAPIPKAWAEKTAKIAFFRAHESGGHFAALERPETLWADVEEWVKAAWR